MDNNIYLLEVWTGKEKVTIGIFMFQEDAEDAYEVVARALQALGIDNPDGVLSISSRRVIGRNLGCNCPRHQGGEG